MDTAILNNQKIELSTLSKEEMKQIYKQINSFKCPECKQDLILKMGDKKRPHFAHKVNCSCVGSTPESELHHLVKQLFYDWAVKQKANQVGLEVRLPHLNRIADVYFEIFGKPYVIEIQKSMISEILLQERTNDYRQAGIKVFWVIIGQRIIKKQTHILNPLLVKNKQYQMIYFDVGKKEISIYQQLYYLTPKEVVQQCVPIKLESLRLCDFLNEEPLSQPIERNKWLEIKKRFRMSQWMYYLKSDKRLRQLCYEKHISLSLVPAEVGWPIVNNTGFNKPLFIWQTYVLVGIIMYFKIGHLFTIRDIVQVLKYRYKFYIKFEDLKQVYREVGSYLAYLVSFKIIEKLGGYYEYRQEPKTFKTLEGMLKLDQQLADGIKKALR